MLHEHHVHVFCVPVYMLLLDLSLEVELLHYRVRVCVCVRVCACVFSFGRSTKQFSKILVQCRRVPDTLYSQYPHQYMILSGFGGTT